MRALSSPIAWIVWATLAGMAGDGLDAVPLPAGSGDLEAIVALVREHRRAEADELHQALAALIYDEAVSAEIDPLLVASIIAKESAFLPRAVSPKGALGLMQVVPAVARSLQARADVAWAGTQSLESPQVNLRLGILYFKDLVARFDGDSQKALTAYNAGPTRVARQLRKGTYRPSRYAREVLDLHSRLLEKS